MAGRNTLLTESVQNIIVQAILNCNYMKTACHMAGVEYTTVYYWLQRGRDKEQEDGTIIPGEEPYKTFHDAVRQAEADAEANLVAVWQNEAKVNWTAAKDLLSRRYSGNWAPKDKAVLDVNVKGKIEHELTTTDELSAYAETLRIATGRSVLSSCPDANTPKE